MKLINRNTELPKEGKTLLCYCPNWCELGYQVATFEDGKFTYPEVPNHWFDENVVSWGYIKSITAPKGQ